MDVLTAQEDGSDAVDDALLLDRAGELGRVLLSTDRDLLIIASERQSNNETFGGVIYAPQTAPLGQVIADLELCVLVGVRDDFAGTVTYLPFA